MRSVLLYGAVIAALLASAAHAQPPQTAVSITIGPELQRKTADFGDREVADLSDALRRTVAQAAAAAGPKAPARIDLVLEDATPNRPTPAQLGRNVGLSFSSIGLGGARVSGLVTYADGVQRPFREQFFETDLADDRGADRWYDAYRAFDQVAYDVKHSHYPAEFHGPGAQGDGHFGFYHGAGSGQ
jgi:hypothetical protein